MARQVGSTSAQRCSPGGAVDLQIVCELQQRRRCKNSVVCAKCAGAPELLRGVSASKGSARTWQNEYDSAVDDSVPAQSDTARGHQSCPGARPAHLVAARPSTGLCFVSC